MLRISLQDADATCWSFSCWSTFASSHCVMIMPYSRWTKRQTSAHVDKICPTYAQNSVCSSVLQLHIFLYHRACYNGDRLNFDMLIVSFLGKDGGLNRCRNDWKWRRTGNVDRASVLKSSLVKALAVAKFLVHNCFCYSAHQHSFLGLSWFNIGKNSFFLFFAI